MRQASRRRPTKTTPRQETKGTGPTGTGSRIVVLVALSEVDAEKHGRLLRYTESVASGEAHAPEPDSAPIPDYMHVAKSTCRPRLTEHEIDRIIAEYQDGNTIPEIASKHDRCYTTILNQLRKAGMDTERSDGRVVVTKIRRPQKYLDRDEIDHLIAEYRAGSTIYELAERFGCHRQTVSRHLKAHGVQMRLRPLTEEQIQEVVRLYESGLSLQGIGDQIGACKSTVRSKLVERGTKLHTNDASPTSPNRHTAWADAIER